MCVYICVGIGMPGVRLLLPLSLSLVYTSWLVYKCSPNGGQKIANLLPPSSTPDHSGSYISYPPQSVSVCVCVCVLVSVVIYIKSLCALVCVFPVCYHEIRQRECLSSDDGKVGNKRARR